MKYTMYHITVFLQNFRKFKLISNNSKQASGCLEMAGDKGEGERN